MIRALYLPSSLGLAVLALIGLSVASGQEAKKDNGKSAARQPAKTAPAKSAPSKAAPKAAAPPAQGEKVGPKFEKAEIPAPATGARGEFDRQMEEWKTLLKDLRVVRTEFQSAKEAEQKELQDQFNALIAKGNEMLPKLRDSALAAYIESEGADPQLERFLLKLVGDAVDNDDFENGLVLAKHLIEAGSSDKLLQAAAGICSFCTNDYEAAETYFKIAQESGVFNDENEITKLGLQLMPQISTVKGLWEKELEIRKEEEAQDDLPRVKLTTNKGVIVIELFENEAPDTVGNFISLVEKKFYDGLVFHRVLAHFMAQGGDPKGDGTGGPGYQIYCECHKPEYRRHFRGSLSMAHAGRDTGGSQFFLTFRPTPELDGRHTCFGRVIEGMEVLAKIQRKDPEKDMESGQSVVPDKIVTAEVVRKRDHAYAPKKVEQ